MDQVIYQILSVVATVVLGVIGNYAHQSTKNKQLQQSLDIASQYAKDIVISLSQRSDLSNTEKFKQAYVFVADKLKKQNIDVTAQTIENKINEVYQTYKMDGGDIHKFIPDVAKQQLDDAVQSFVTPESRMVAPTQVQNAQPVQSEDPVQQEQTSQPVSVPVADAPKEEVKPQVTEQAQQAPVNPYATK